MNRRKFVGILAAAPAAAGMAGAIADAASPAAKTLHAGHKMPAPHVIGDIWVDTANGNKVYHWNGTAWVTPVAG